MALATGRSLRAATPPAAADSTPEGGRVIRPDMSEDVALLVERALGGDTSAAERLVRLHMGAAFAVALAVTRSREDAEDVVQDAFVVALERLDECRPERYPGWLLQIVRNRGRNYRRYLGVRTAAPIDTAGAHASKDRPDHDTEKSELRERLSAAVAELPPVQREVVLLHDLEGWKHREIADALGMPAGTVRHHLFHARRALRARLGVLAREED